MSVIRTHQYRSASRQVLDWCAWYTRDLAPEIADERRDEIASDLHEHAVWAEEAGVAPKRLRREIVLRAIRGIPHDLTWRSGQLRAGFVADPLPLGTRRVGNALAALVVIGGVLLAAVGSFLLVRILRALVIGDVIEAPAGAVGVALATVLATVGVVLALRRRSRWLGALLLAPAAALLGALTGEVMYLVSATGGLVISRLSSYGAGPDPWWVLAVSVGAGASLGFIGAAIWWWPSKQRTVEGGAMAPMTTGGTA